MDGAEILSYLSSMVPTITIRYVLSLAFGCFCSGWPSLIRWLGKRRNPRLMRSGVAIYGDSSGMSSRGDDPDQILVGCCPILTGGCHDRRPIPRHSSTSLKLSSMSTSRSTSGRSVGLSTRSSTSSSSPSQEHSSHRLSSRVLPAQTTC